MAKSGNSGSEAKSEVLLELLRLDKGSVVALVGHPIHVMMVHFPIAFVIATLGVAIMLQNGMGVPQDYAEAAQWYRRAADSNYPEAMNNLGVLYQDGHGVPQSLAEALRYYRLAADEYYPPAINNLAGMYQKGLGVPPDIVEAVRLYRRAADAGNTFAQNNLGAMYATGQGVPQDYLEAHKWFSLSLALGNPIATRNQERAAAFLTPAQLAESAKFVQSWHPGPVSVPSITIGPAKESAH